MRETKRPTIANGAAPAAKANEARAYAARSASSPPAPATIFVIDMASLK
jgi:hypothetical protein